MVRRLRWFVEAWEWICHGSMFQIHRVVGEVLKIHSRVWATDHHDLVVEGTALPKHSKEDDRRRAPRQCYRTGRKLQDRYMSQIAPRKSTFFDICMICAAHRNTFVWIGMFNLPSNDQNIVNGLHRVAVIRTDEAEQSNLMLRATTGTAQGTASS